MQNPTTPTPSPRTAGLAMRWSMAEPMSRAADPRLRLIMSLSASSGSLAVSPRNRSGARAVKPSAAKRSHTSSMWGTSPQYSWMTTRPGPAPCRGGEK